MLEHLPDDLHASLSRILCANDVLVVRSTCRALHHSQLLFHAHPDLIVYFAALACDLDGLTIAITLAVLPRSSSAGAIAVKTTSEYVVIVESNVLSTAALLVCSETHYDATIIAGIQLLCSVVQAGIRFQDRPMIITVLQCGMAGALLVGLADEYVSEQQQSHVVPREQTLGVLFYDQFQRYLDLDRELLTEIAALGAALPGRLVQLVTVAETEAKLERMSL
ncbi:hypothetical protein BC828DRAFT_405058 [Blastocladiella britannica]|nr:hypothetical protein BC828DRAFT_405058 [Blastocladiella britannica]